MYTIWLISIANWNHHAEEGLSTAAAAKRLATAPVVWEKNQDLFTIHCKIIRNIAI